MVIHSEPPKFNADINADNIPIRPNPSEIPFEIQEQWHSKPEKMRVICVGAGAAGLLVAYKLKKQLQEYELLVYEKSVFYIFPAHSLTYHITSRSHPPPETQP